MKISFFKRICVELGCCGRSGLARVCCELGRGEGGLGVVMGCERSGVGCDCEKEGCGRGVCRAMESGVGTGFLSVVLAVERSESAGQKRRRFNSGVKRSADDAAATLAAVAPCWCCGGDAKKSSGLNAKIAGVEGLGDGEVKGWGVALLAAAGVVTPLSCRLAGGCIGVLSCCRLGDWSGKEAGSSTSGCSMLNGSAYSEGEAALFCESMSTLHEECRWPTGACC